MGWNVLRGLRRLIAIGLSVSALFGFEAALAQSQVIFGPVSVKLPNSSLFTFSNSFSAPASATGPYLLRVQLSAPNSLTSLTFKLNNVQVLSLADFANGATQVDRTVTVLTNNTYSLQVAGKAGTVITVTVFATPNLPKPTSLAPNPLSVTVGASGTLTATLSPTPTAAGTLNVTSANTAVATVPASVSFASGQTSVAIPVTTHAVGSAIITASANGGQASATVNVTPAPPTVTSLAPQSLAVTQGASGSLTVTISAAQTADTQVLLASSNANIASVASAVTVLAGHGADHRQPERVVRLEPDQREPGGADRGVARSRDIDGGPGREHHAHAHDLGGAEHQYCCPVECDAHRHRVDFDAGHGARGPDHRPGCRRHARARPGRHHRKLERHHGLRGRQRGGAAGCGHGAGARELHHERGGDEQLHGQDQRGADNQYPDCAFGRQPIGAADSGFGDGCSRTDERGVHRDRPCRGQRAHHGIGERDVEDLERARFASSRRDRLAPAQSLAAAGGRDGEPHGHHQRRAGDRHGHRACERCAHGGARRRERDHRRGSDLRDDPGERACERHGERHRFGERHER